MDEKKLERQLQRAKRANYIIFAICACLIVAVAAGLLSGHIKHTFTQKRWDNHPGERYKMVDSLLERHDLAYMDREQLFELLGDDCSSDADGSVETLRYFLGRDTWGIGYRLVITLQNGRVTEYELVTST